MTPEDREKIEREIRDGCPECARKLAALDVLFDGWDKGPAPEPAAERPKRAYKKRGPRPALGKGLPETKDAAETKPRTKDPRGVAGEPCDVCKKLLTEKGSKPCESCGKAICTLCRSAKDQAICKPCDDLETAEGQKNLWRKNAAAATGFRL